MVMMESEFLDLDRNEGWGTLYQRIRNESSLYEYTIADARKPENRHYNRYRDVSPYDHSRVQLQSGDSDYINASLIKVSQANRRYICAQGPLPHTSGHFWQMIWEQNTKAVVMLNKIIEKNTIKCHQYYPLGEEYGGEDVIEFDAVGLQVVYLGEEDCSYYTIRHLQLVNLRTEETREVLHFHYTTWPDFGVPQSPAAFLNFLYAVRESGSLEPGTGPPVIHCSAGIGRSGTFCLVDTCLVLIANSRDPSATNIIDILLDMRRYRMGLIQTPDQLRFSYLAVIAGAKQILELTTIEDAADKNIETQCHIPHVTETTERRRANSRGDVDINNMSQTANQQAVSDVAGKDVNVSPVSQTEQLSPERTSSDQELRRRQRHERQRRTQEQVERMKRKDREFERWRPYRSYLRPCLTAGVLLLVGGGYLLYRYYYGSSSGSHSNVTGIGTEL